jgi:hypothetical protein
MLYRDLLNKQLHDNRKELLRFIEAWEADKKKAADLLLELPKTELDELKKKFLADTSINALPAPEMRELNSLFSAFSESWQNHEEARAWAQKVLSNRTTFAADGSQLSPDKSLSLPFAAVQVGWFENHHNAAGEYQKDASLKLLSPAELLSQDGPNGDRSNRDARIGLLRFEQEVEVICEFLERKTGWRERGEKMPLAFFDGTLLISISLPKTTIQERYAKGVLKLVTSSEQAGVPLVGYIDQSEARDVISLLSGVSGPTILHDSHVLRAAGKMTNWGDRTIFFYARRQNLPGFFDEENAISLAGFVYLQTTAEGNPARLDIPSWVYEAGLLGEVVDSVRAECVIGLGYPYALETADATAVISTRDREGFFSALQNFAEREKISLPRSRKPVSKGRRR